MHPVHDFRENFVTPDLADTATGHLTGVALDESELYETDSQVRNVCFVWEDGRKAFFNYAYLILGEYQADSDINLIRLNFSSYMVSLHGYGLEPLFMALLGHLPRLIPAIDPRYVLEEDKSGSIVIAISVEKKEE